MTLTAKELAGIVRSPEPFTLALDGRDVKDYLVKCNEIIRAIPGRRLVCQGKWQGEDVFIKLYLGTDKLFNKELQGLSALHKAGILAPIISYSGTADKGAIYIIMLKPIQPAITLESAWDATGDEQARIKLLELSVHTIADHHRAGLEQIDIHLDNFLLSGSHLFTIDGGGIYSSPEGELTLKETSNNLALFFAQFYPEYDYLVDAVLPVYESRRQIKAGSLVPGDFHKRIIYYRRRRQRKFLKKIFRDCSAFMSYKDVRRFMVCDRKFASPSMLKFLADPDASLKQADSEYLKKGNTCTLWRVRVGQQTLVVKRYNIKSLSHRISRMFRKTRAAISWRNAHLLEMNGIFTSKPIALVERRLGFLRGKAWYVSEYVEGNDAQALCEPAVSGSELAQVAAESIIELLCRLEHCRISHGDMKVSNIILSEQGATLIDLDAMKQHSCKAGFCRPHQRDLHRFMRNWQTCPLTSEMFDTLLRKNKLI